MDSQQRNTIECIDNIYGFNIIYSLVAEECGELIQSVMKLNRVESGDPSVRIKSNAAQLSVDEEIADVLICLERLQNKLDNRDRVNFFINKKLNRTLSNIRSIVVELEPVVGYSFNKIYVLSREENYCKYLDEPYEIKEGRDIVMKIGQIMR